ncbi:bifunctional phosphopantothenoylcysteine decarboxylase/phosphopantothenate--cysteine ligase CoaBC [Calditrichota bacterium]
MIHFKNKKILLGISGGIAAYKTAGLVREWIKAGAEVEIVMTKSAQEFITSLTMETLIGRQVHTHLFPKNQFSATIHVDLADWADVVIIAPATANIIGKIRQGIGDDLLSTICLAAHRNMVIAPAMNSNMWLNPAVQENIRILEDRGYLIIPPDSGDLACGYTGQGRLPDSWVLNHWLSFKLQGNKSLAGKNVIVTAGRTEEPFDPARIITNRSSAKMGFALAKEAFYRGANVVLISGPNNLATPNGIKYITINTAAEMYKAVEKNWKETDVFISAAAVSDYRPKTQLKQKMKKSAADFNINFVANPDILALFAKKKEKRTLIGFAVETENERDNALTKMKKKKLDMIVVNNPLKKGSGFSTDTNQVTIYKKDGQELKLPLLQKDEVAAKILDAM